MSRKKTSAFNQGTVFQVKRKVDVRKTRRVVTNDQSAVGFAGETKSTWLDNQRRQMFSLPNRSIFVLFWVSYRNRPGCGNWGRSGPWSADRAPGDPPDPGRCCSNHWSVLIRCLISFIILDIWFAFGSKYVVAKVLVGNSVERRNANDGTIFRRRRRRGGRRVGGAWRSAGGPWRRRCGRCARSPSAATRTADSTNCPIRYRQKEPQFYRFSERLCDSCKIAVQSGLEGCDFFGWRGKKRLLIGYREASSHSAAAFVFFTRIDWGSRWKE